LGRLKTEKSAPELNKEEEATCDEDCQSMCHMFNPKGDCSHCGCDNQKLDQEQKRVQQDEEGEGEEEEEEICDEDCQSMCHMFNPKGDCSHCGCDNQKLDQEQKRVQQDEEGEEKNKKKKRHATKIVNQCVTCSIQKETVPIADVIIRNRTRPRKRKECSRAKKGKEKKNRHATKIVNQCATCSIQKETVPIADASDVFTQMVVGKLLKV